MTRRVVSNKSRKSRCSSTTNTTLACITHNPIVLTNTRYKGLESLPADVYLHAPSAYPLHELPNYMTFEFCSSDRTPNHLETHLTPSKPTQPHSFPPKNLLS